MGKSFLIDGYNLLHGMGMLHGRAGPHGLEEARASLLDFLASAFGEERGRLTVVFDGARAPRRIHAEQHIQGITVLFAKGWQEADDVIEELIAGAGSPRELVVVSSDHRLEQAARRRQAQSLDCAAFLDYLDERRQPPVAPSAASSPAASEKWEKPTEEETRRWVEEFKDLQKYLDRLEPF